MFIFGLFRKFLDVFTVLINIVDYRTKIPMVGKFKFRFVISFKGETPADQTVCYRLTVWSAGIFIIHMVRGSSAD